jgi:hypothetical protein
MGISSHSDAVSGTRDVYADLAEFWDSGVLLEVDIREAGIPKGSFRREQFLIPIVWSRKRGESSEDGFVIKWVLREIHEGERTTTSQPSN